MGRLTESEYINATKRIKEIYEEKRNLLFQIELTKFDEKTQKELINKKQILDLEERKNKVLIRTYEIENNIEKEEKENDKYKRK